MELYAHSSQFNSWKEQLEGKFCQTLAPVMNSDETLPRVPTEASVIYSQRLRK